MYTFDVRMSKIEIAHLSITVNLGGVESRDVILMNVDTWAEFYTFKIFKFIVWIKYIIPR